MFPSRQHPAHEILQGNVAKKHRESPFQVVFFLAGKERAFIVFGIENRTKKKVGTTVRLTEMTKGAENFQNAHVGAAADARAPRL